MSSAPVPESMRAKHRDDNRFLAAIVSFLFLGRHMHVPAIAVASASSRFWQAAPMARVSGRLNPIRVVASLYVGVSMEPARLDGRFWVRRVPSAEALQCAAARIVLRLGAPACVVGRRHRAECEAGGNCWPMAGFVVRRGSAGMRQWRVRLAGVETHEIYGGLGRPGNFVAWGYVDFWCVFVSPTVPTTTRAHGGPSP